MAELVPIASSERPLPPHLPSILWGYRKKLAIGALTGLLIGLAIALRRPTTYTAQATLIFPAAPASGLAALTGQGGGDLPSMPLLGGALSVPQLGSSATSASFLVKSRRLRQHVIASLNLAERWKLDNELQVIKRFDNGLQCTEGTNGELSVGFRDESRELAYQIATAVVKELKRLIAELRLDPAADNVRFVERKARQAEQRVASAQRELAGFQKAHRIIDLPSQARALAERYADLQKEAITSKVEAAIAARQSEMLSSSARQMVEAAIDPSPGPGNALGPLYQRVQDAESQLAQLKYQLTDEHPDVQEQKRIVDLARQQLKAETQRQLSALKSGGSSPALSAAVLQAAGSRARAAGLERALSNLQREMEKMPDQEATFMQLSGALQAHLAEAKLYREELEKARILAQSRGPVFVELDPAEMPRQRDPSGRVPLVLLPLLMGLGVAMIFPYWEWTRRSEAYEAALRGPERTITN